MRIGNLNNPVSFFKIKFVIQNCPTKEISKCWLKCVQTREGQIRH